MDLKTRMEVLPCGKCEDMLGCDNCLFQKEAKELYEQIRADAIDKITEKYLDAIEDVLTDIPSISVQQALSIYSKIINKCNEILEQFKEKTE